MKEFKESAMIHKCSKCKGKALRSDKGYKIANAIMAVSAFVLAFSFFGLIPEEASSIALIFLVPSTIAIFYFLYGKKEGDYVCKDCGHKQTEATKK